MTLNLAFDPIMIKAFRPKLEVLFLAQLKCRVSERPQSYTGLLLGLPQLFAIATAAAVIDVLRVAAEQQFVVRAKRQRAYCLRPAEGDHKDNY